MFESYQGTDRVQRIFNLSLELVEGNDRVIQPAHLFIGACLERTGVCSELFLFLSKQLGYNFIDEMTAKIDVNQNNLSLTISVLEDALKYMKRYNQIKINEGHLLRAILENDEVYIPMLTYELKKTIMGFATVARDMAVNLSNYVFPNLDIDCTIRRATPNDFGAVSRYVFSHHGEGWLNSIRNGFASGQDIPIYIALDGEEMIGFACYDVFSNKKGVFGPMGISLEVRKKGIGAALLHHCLRDMSQLGYHYGILGEAGPLEFYEKTCNAQLIPIMS